MAAEKVSLTLEAELLAEARKMTGSRALSRYVNRALSLQLQHDRLSCLLADLDREHGPVDPQVLAEVQQEWPAPAPRVHRRRSG